MNHRHFEDEVANQNQDERGGPGVKGKAAQFKKLVGSKKKRRRPARHATKNKKKTSVASTGKNSQMSFFVFWWFEYGKAQAVLHLKVERDVLKFFYIWWSTTAFMSMKVSSWIRRSFRMHSSENCVSVENNSQTQIFPWFICEFEHGEAKLYYIFSCQTYNMSRVFTAYCILYLVTEVGNWPKKRSALALEIVSLKCNALVILH